MVWSFVKKIVTLFETEEEKEERKKISIMKEWLRIE